jgi:hypothetical protein
MTYISASLRRKIYDKAEGRCEYCHIHNDDSYLPHEVDHIYAEKHGGTTTEDNLCLCCMICNRYKGSDLASLDPITGEITPLFHPRKDKWDEHFHLSGAVIEPVSAQARVTIKLLQLNKPDRVLERRQLILMGRF